MVVALEKITNVRKRTIAVYSMGYVYANITIVLKTVSQKQVLWAE
jgi:hypothetical protein